MQKRCLISFTNDDALIWRLKMYMDSLNPELYLALKVLYILWFSSQPLFIFLVIESPSMKITEKLNHSPPSYTDPNWLSGQSTQARLTGTFCAQNSEKANPVPGPSGTIALAYLMRSHLQTEQVPFNIWMHKAFRKLCTLFWWKMTPSVLRLVPCESCFHCHSSCHQPGVFIEK